MRQNVDVFPLWPQVLSSELILLSPQYIITNLHQTPFYVIYLLLYSTFSVVVPFFLIIDHRVLCRSRTNTRFMNIHLCMYVYIMYANIGKETYYKEFVHVVMESSHDMLSPS